MPLPKIGARLTAFLAEPLPLVVGTMFPGNTLCLGTHIVSRYLLQGTYTPEAWAAMLKNPQNRAQGVAPLLQSLGGSIETAYFAFGEYDTAVIVNLPDSVTAPQRRLPFPHQRCGRQSRPHPC
jgi:uncharacterized protein with GYD domain